MKHEQLHDESARGPGHPGSPRDDESVPEVVTELCTHKLGLGALIGIGFFWVCGGMYGNEAMLAAAPPGILIITLIGFALLYALPTALMCAELASALPEDGGAIVWVNRALGTTVGTYNAWASYACWVLDCSIYPVLASNYVIGTLPNVYSWAYGGCGMSIVIFVTIIKLFGLEFLAKLSTIMAVLSLLPCMLYVGAGLPHLRGPEIWWNFDGKVRWVLLLSWMLWLFGGFFGLGAIAGQVHDVRRTYTRGTAILLLITLVVNLLPVFVSVSINPDRSKFEPGFFAEQAGHLLGHWMHYAMTAGAVISNLGLFNAQVLYSDIALLFLLNKLFPSWMARHKALGTWWWRLRDGNCPAVILTNAGLISALVWLPYDVIVECAMLASSVLTMLAIVAFGVLRVKEPKLRRPFKVPGGKVGGTVLLLPAFLLTLGNMVLGVTPIEGVIWKNLQIRIWFVVGLFGGALLTHAGVIMWRRWTKPAVSLQHEQLEEDSEESVLMDHPMGGTAEDEAGLGSATAREAGLEGRAVSNGAEVPAANKTGTINA